MERGVIGSREKVVVISTANGLKFPEFKIRYHEARLADVEPRYPNLPIDVAPDYDAIRDAVLRSVESLPV